MWCLKQLPIFITLPIFSKNIFLIKKRKTFWFPPLTNGSILSYPVVLLLVLLCVAVRSSTLLLTPSFILFSLAESSQTDMKALPLLEEYALLSLEPMLEIQQALWLQISSDPNPSSLYKWIVKEIDETHRAKSEFTFALFKW